MTWRMEVEVDGEFVPLRGVESPLAWVDEVPLPLEHRNAAAVPRTSWSVEGRVTGGENLFRSLFGPPRVPAWIRHPYPGARR